MAPVAVRAGALSALGLVLAGASAGGCQGDARSCTASASMLQVKDARRRYRVRAGDEGCSGGEALEMASRAAAGTALVVGANVGPVPNDPSWGTLASRGFDHIDKVFLEPHPGLFKKLEENVKAMPRARAIQAALTNASGPMTLYCLGIDENGDTTPEARATPGFQEWWSQLCSGSPERLASKYDVQSVVEANVSALVMAVDVPKMTAAEVLEALPSPVQYLQIDVEGFDDQVLSQLASQGEQHEQGPLSLLFESASFRPQSIVFEWVQLGQERLDAAIHSLQTRGYATCFEGQNVVCSLQTSP